MDLSEKAFDRFYRGDEARAKSIEGMGLGLSICKEIANFHQAFLTLEVTSSESVKLRLTIFKNSKMTA
jgi:signal transduction histidine kinase